MHSGFEVGGVQVALDVLLAAIGFDAEEEAVDPHRRMQRLGGEFIAQQVEGGRLVEGRRPQAVGNWLDLQRKAAFAGDVAMVIAVRHQRLQVECQRLAAAGQGVLDVRGVGALLHPQALLEPRIGEGERPHRRRALEVEALQVAKALGGDPRIAGFGLVGPAIGEEGIALAIVGCGFVQLGQERVRAAGAWPGRPGGAIAAISRPW